MPTTPGIRISGTTFKDATLADVPPALVARAQKQLAKAPNDPGDRGFAGPMFVAKGSVDGVLKYAASLEDAGNAIPVAKNADLHMVGFSYHSGDRREAWLGNKPADGKLRLQVVLTPSWHKSDVPEPTAPPDPPEDAPQAVWDKYEKDFAAYEKAFDRYAASGKEWATKFAKTNTYHVTVTYPGGKVDRVDFKVNGKTPEWSSASPEIAIDLKQKGDIVIRGWAEGSAGADGYASARVTVLHNT
jgi:hypothetical protein